MTKSRWEDAQEAQTLREANAALGRLRPHRTETNPVVWRDFYKRSAAIYREIAEIDRAHHHEAMSWAINEQHYADQWEVQVVKHANR